MSNCCEFVWQYEQRKKWVTYSNVEICELNKAVKEGQKSFLLPSKNTRKRIVVDFKKMVQKNKASSYEQRVRCLAFNSEFFIWLWRDKFDEWQCFQPNLCFLLEVAHHKNEKKLQYSDEDNYEVNLETFKQLNENDSSICNIKREVIDLTITSDLKESCRKNEASFKQACAGAPSSKRIKLASSCTDTSLKINLPQNLLDVPDLDSVQNGANSSSVVPVDSECPEGSQFHIYLEDSILYSAMLNQTNLQNNNNKFYMIQLLENNRKKQYAVWRRWGRVGNRGQSDFSNFGSNLSEAKKSFDEKFFAKTRNHWSDHQNFVHCKGKYDLLHMDLNPEEHSIMKVTKTGIESKLVAKLQSLMELICDESRMLEIVKEMKYDSKRTPLGKLTLKQVKDGYIALNKIATVLASGEKGVTLLNACNEFYTKIPHSFGMKTPPIIQSQREIDDKIAMLEALSNITVAMGVLNAKSNKEEHPLDKYYRSLDCLLDPVTPLSPEYLEIENCLKSTHGATHANYEMEIVDVFKSFKANEQNSFLNSENKLLLWHGSRITNWLGILKEGLRIAPPEAPCSGYMFGKGIYLADASSKSANYCHATRSKNEGLLLLCEVSVGNQFQLNRAKTDLPVGLPSDCNSTFGQGRMQPSEFKTGLLSSEAKTPFGPLVENLSYDGSLIYNEYIVYKVEQVKMRYLVRVKFNFK